MAVAPFFQSQQRHGKSRRVARAVIYGEEGMECRDAVSRWAGWALAHPKFGVSVNPIPTRGVDYAHQITVCPPGFENLKTSLVNRRKLQEREQAQS